MSAPDTNLKKQRRRHRGPLIGMAVAVTVASLLLLWLIARTVSDAPDETADPTPPSAETSTGLPAEGSPTGATDTGAPETIQDSPSPED